MELRLIIILLAIVSYNTHAQNPYHVKYDVKDGLPSMEIYDSELDSLGRLVLTTDRGLSVYDGYAFKNYSTHDGLTNNTNFELIKSEDDKFFICGYDGTVSIFKDGKITEFEGSELLSQFKPDLWINYLQENKDSSVTFLKGAIFGDGSYDNVYDYSSGKISPSQSKIVHENELFEILEANGKLFARDKSTKLHNYTVHKTGNDYYVIYDISFISFRRNINEDLKTRVSGTKSQIHIVRNGSLDETINLSYEVLESYIIENNLWLCTRNGLLVYSFSNGAYSLVKYFPDLSITSITIDKEGNYWLTSLHGLVKVPSFKIFNIKDDLRTKLIREIEGIRNGLIANSEFGIESSIINSSGELIYIQDKTNQPMSHLKKIDNNSVINTTNSIVTIEDDKLVYNETHRNKSLSKFPNAFRKSIFLSNGNIACGSNKLYITKDGENLKTLYEENNIKAQITALYEDKLKRLWVGTVNGLFMSGDINNIDLDPFGLKEELSNFRISQIECDSNNGVWLTTVGNGPFFYPFKGEQPIHINAISKYEVPDFINCFKIQNDSTIWFGTNEGLFRMHFNATDSDLKIKGIEHFDSSDGLMSNFIHDIEYWEDKIWITTSGGMNFFKPESIEISKSLPHIIIDSICSYSRNLFKDKSTSLERNENDLDFHFTGISFTKKSDTPFYRYKLSLDNTDTEWEYTNNKNIRFTNLNPGHYNFQVAAHNKIGQWSLNPAQYYFEIEKRTTEELWFRILLFAMGLIGTYIIYKLREGQILRKEKQSQLLQEAEYKVKNAELEALRNQMNPHFIYNALNSIQNFIFQDNPEQANFFLSKFSRLMRNSLEMSKLQYINISDEISFLENYLELEKLRFQNKFTYAIKVEDSISADLKIPPLLLQPLIENCIKHAFKKKEVQGIIRLNFKSENGKTIISIIDNGQGFKNKNEDHNSLGMKIISERLEIINAKEKTKASQLKIIDRKSIEGTEGSIVQITLPNKT